ncbi:MAG: DUF808 domain-containing protein [Planctomycetes bacterium]|nr:DUF808 domain-containing protein [Planctomycetota bacterium]
MYYSLAQIIVIARGNDEGWMNILVLVVLAAVYGIGALIKAKSKKAEDPAQEQQAGKPQRKPSAGGGILEQLFREIQQFAEGKPTQETRPSGQTTNQQSIHSLAAARKYAAETKQARQTQSISAPVQSKLSKPTPHAQPDFEISPVLDTDTQLLPEFTTNVVGLAGKRKRMPVEVAGSGYLSELLSDYEDPNELKRAILHYEILGKPLALRDPS